MHIGKRIHGTLLFFYYRIRGVVISALFWVVPVYFLWNWLATSVFGMRPVTPEEALGLSAALAIMKQ